MKQRCYESSVITVLVAARVDNEVGHVAMTVHSLVTHCKVFQVLVMQVSGLKTIGYAEKQSICSLIERLGHASSGSMSHSDELMGSSSTVAAKIMCLA